MSDPEVRLARLRRKLEHETDPEERADLEASIAALEEKLHVQTIADQAQVGTAIAGGVRGNVTNMQGGVTGPVISGEVRSLFPEGSASNYLAGVINVFAQPASAPTVDYEGALKRYLEDLYHQHATVDLRGVDDRQVQPPLRDLYISLSLSQPRAGDLRQGIRRFMARVAEAVKLHSLAEDLTVAELSQELAWPDALRAHPLIAVIGAPGSGKTTLLHYTAIRLAEALAHDDQGLLQELGLDRPFVPILLPLRELGQYIAGCEPRELIGNNPRLLLGCIHAYAERNLDLPVNFFERLCEEGRAILLLDGLDEVASTQDRQMASALIDAFTTRYAQCRYLVTARVAAYIGDAQLNQRFVVCTVNPLTRTQQQHFITNWSHCVYRLTLPHAPEEQVQRESAAFDRELIDALVGNSAVGTLADNPLLLTIIAIVFYNQPDLPENRAALYDACVAVLLRGGRGKVSPAGKQREIFSGVDGVRMPLDEKRELLAAIAFRMHSGGEGTKRITREQLLAWTAEHLERSYHDSREAQRRARAFVEELPVHLGLLDELEQHVYGFSHLTFQEFLAARHIADTDQWQVLFAHYQESWWREVIFLCAGHLSQERCWRFLRGVAEQGSTPSEQAVALLLVAEVLRELERFKGQGTVRDLVRERALALVAAPHSVGLTPARVRAGQALGMVGDPRPGVASLPPAMVRFAGGSFQIGHTEEEYRALIRADRGQTDGRYTKGNYKVTINIVSVAVAPFELACYPITNAQWALFIAAGGYQADQPWWDAAGRAWLEQYKRTEPPYWRHDRFGYHYTSHPVVTVTWYEAVAFCRWLTLHLNDGNTYTLPSELEWEYAARGAARRMYPWGDQEPDDERANFNQTYNGTTAVGCFPAGATPEGLFDMAGNVWEWTRSEYRAYPCNPGDGREQGNDSAEKRFTLRGGSWCDLPLNLRASYRFYDPPVIRSNYIGLRLARHKR